MIKGEHKLLLIFVGGFSIGFISVFIGIPILYTGVFVLYLATYPIIAILGVLIKQANHP